MAKVTEATILSDAFRDLLLIAMAVPQNPILNLHCLPSFEPRTFCAACYDMNSLDELAESIRSDAGCDKDMRTWGISKDEWTYAIRLAAALCLADNYPEVARG